MRPIAAPASAQTLEPLEARKLLATNIPVSVNVNPAQTLQTIEGMGASMIPWHFNTEYADPNFFNLIAGDLGASMARASILPLAENTNDDADPNHFNWAGFDSSKLAAPFDFFQQLKARGVDRFVGSVWTAPAWMKTNSFYTDGGALRPDDYGEFAEYLSAVTQIASRDYGINLMAISPQNEPYFVEPYESTTYTANQFARMLAAVVIKFKHDNVKTKLLGPEDLIYEDRNSWYLSKIAADPIASQFDGYVGGHGLQGHWKAFSDVIAPYGREWWQTEMSGNSNTWEGAMGVASSIMSSIGDANASTFLYWQFSDNATNVKTALMTDGQPTLKYYAAKQFYRYIRPGMVHVGSTSSAATTVRSATFKNPTTGAMTTVVVNSGEAADVTFDFTGTGLPGTYKVFRSSSKESFVSLGTITGGSKFTMTIPGASIVTITNVPELPAVNLNTAIPTNVQFSAGVSFWAGKPFYIAALKGYDDVMRQLIGEGQDVNKALGNGWTALILAAASAHPTSITTLQTLLADGANVNAVNNENWTPLIAASANTFTKYGSLPTMQADKITALLNAGADVNARDINGRTGLMWAAMVGSYNFFTQDPTMLKTLLKGGANPFLKDNFGKTALDYANAGGYERLADVLIAAMGLDKVKPTGNIVDVFPDPRTTPVTDFDINFSERVQGFDISDLTLTRDGVVLPLPTDGGVTLTSTNSDDIHFHLAGLGGFTNGNGTYVLSISASASGITDPSGNPLAADVSDTWFKGTTPPPPPPTEQKPFKGTPFAISKSATTQIELEDFDTGGEGVAYHDVESKNQGAAYRTSEGVDIQPTTDAGGGFNVGYAKPGEWIEYTINVADAGSYDFNFRLASTGSNGKFHATVDGVDATGAITVPNTGGYQTWQTLTKSGVSLAAGQHVLRIAMDAASTNGSVGNFNWLKISPAGTPPPPPPPVQTPFKGSPYAVGSTPVTIQAEDFDNGGEGVAYHDSDAINSVGSTYRTGASAGVDVEATGDTGGGNDVGFTKAGEWLEYTINVSPAGTYNFDFRVASKGAGGTFHASIDDVNVTGSLAVPNTVAWNTFTTISKTGVALSAGQHVLRLTFDSVGGSGFTGNFNWIKITQLSANPNTGNTTTVPAASAAYVRGGTFAAQNFGTDPTLVVKKHTDPTSSREAYLTFNLPTLAPITNATLRLFGSLNDTSSTSVQSQVFAAAGAFTESSLTWNNRPGSTGIALSTITVTGTTQQWYTLDITSFLKAEQAAGQATVTLVIKNPAQQNALVVFNSDEAASNRPEISVTT
jgi:O-glycosyl hydrolase